MKQLLLIVSMTLTTIVYSQTTSSTGNFAHASSDRDTLYLLKGDTMANLTFTIWKNDPKWNGMNPTILFINSEQMKSYKESYLLVRREKNVKKLNN